MWEYQICDCPLSFEDTISPQFLEKDRKINVANNYWSSLIPKEDYRSTEIF